jgi:hypothetical protein
VLARLSLRRAMRGHEKGWMPENRNQSLPSDLRGPSIYVSFVSPTRLAVCVGVEYVCAGYAGNE